MYIIEVNRFCGEVDFVINLLRYIAISEEPTAV